MVENLYLTKNDYLDEKIVHSMSDECDQMSCQECLDSLPMVNLNVLRRLSYFIKNDKIANKIIVSTNLIEN